MSDRTVQLSELDPSDRARFEWNLYRMAAKIVDLTRNESVRVVCVLIGAHMQGRYWCKANHHDYKEMDLLNWVIVENEYHALQLEGVIK